MINEKTILSVFDGKETLLKWLQKVENALTDGILTGVQIINAGENQIQIKFNFADGTDITSEVITLPKGDTGAQGAPGVGYNYMGAWISNNEYHENDNVTYNGTTYVCISAINGSTTPPASDPTHWAVFAAAATKDNFPVSAQNQLYAHYIDLAFAGTNGNMQGTIYFINSNAARVVGTDIETFYNSISQQISSRFSSNCVCSLINQVGELPTGVSILIRGNIDQEVGLQFIAKNVTAAIWYQQLSLKDIIGDNPTTFYVNDSVIAIGANSGANALVLYADNNGVILDSDSEQQMIAKMEAMTAKGTDMNKIISAMEINGYKVTM